MFILEFNGKSISVKMCIVHPRFFCKLLIDKILHIYMNEGFALLLLFT